METTEATEPRESRNFRELREQVEAKEAKAKQYRAMIADNYVRIAGRDPSEGIGKLLAEKFLSNTRDTEPAELDAAWATFSDTYGIGPAETPEDDQ